MKRHISTAFALSTLAAPLAAMEVASEHDARDLAASCAACHGTNGKSAGPIPTLAGMPKEKIVRSLQDFKSGVRPSTIMSQLSKGYSDAHIEALAAHFSQQR